ncbi:hypothetical protein ACSBR1_034260 [Camellia fascicularis]
MQFLALFLANWMKFKAAGALMCGLGAGGKAASNVCCCTVQKCSCCGCHPFQLAAVAELIFCCRPVLLLFGSFGLSGSLKIPTTSIPVIPLVSMSLLIPVYEFLVVPFARKFTGHPADITQLQRVGVGLVLLVISMDMFAMVGLLEFFYKEAPSGMKSLSISFAPLSLSFGAFLSTMFVHIVNAITKSATRSKKGLEGLILNDSKLNLFYWFLAILNCFNFANYRYWASWYKY